MVLIRHVETDVDKEQGLLTGLIVSDEFSRTILRMVSPDHFKDRYARRLFSWIRDYQSRYHHAPGMEIQSIFNAQKNKLPEAEREILESYLLNLSERYEQETRHNWQYQAELSRNYIRELNIRMLMERVEGFLARGEIAQAEHAILNAVLKSDMQTTQWVFPFTDEEFLDRVLDRSQEKTFRLSGAMGEVFGWWKLGWTVTLFGGTGKGKTWILLEIAIQAMLAGLKVAVFSLEMRDVDIGERLAKIATAIPDEPGKFLLPVWDCVFNQDGSCVLPVRTNKEPLPRDPVDRKPVFQQDAPYRPCTYCQKDPRYLRHYRVASWFAMVEKPVGFAKAMKERVRAFAGQYRADRLALRFFPPGTADMEDIQAALAELEAQNFIPHMIVIDYADKLKSAHKDKIDHLEAVTQDIVRTGLERKAIMVTASQVTREGMAARTLKEHHVPGWVGKLHHIDLAIGLNQTKEAPEGKLSEKEAGVLRLTSLKDPRQGKRVVDQVFILQNLEIGQPALDSFATSSIPTPPQDGRKDGRWAQEPP